MRHTKLLVGASLLALCVAAPAEAATTIGSFTLTPIHSTLNTNHGTTHTVSLVGNTAIPANDIIAILTAVRLNAAADTIVPSDSVSDSGWVSKQCPAAAGATYATSVHVAVTTGISSGGSVSISDTAGATAFTDANITAFGIHGGKTTSIYDALVAACSANSASVTSAAVTSNAGSVSGDLLLSMWGTIGVGVTGITEDAAWTGVYYTGDANMIFGVAGKVNAGTSAVTRTITWTTARPYIMAVLALAPNAAAPAAPQAPLFQSIP